MGLRVAKTESLVLHSQQKPGVQDDPLATTAAAGSAAARALIRHSSYKRGPFASLASAGCGGGLCNMRIQDTDRRERHWSYLKEATGENTKSGAIDTAVRFYLEMAGGTTAVPTGAVEELLAEAEREGSLTVEEIAAILDTDELPIAAETTWSVGAE